MDSQTKASKQPASAEQARAASPYLALTKLMQSLLVVATAAAGFALASDGRPDWLLLAWTLLGTMHAVVGARALSQRLEWRSDAKMQRTPRRQIPAKYISPLLGVLLGSGIAVGGVFILAWRVNWLTAALAVVVLVFYLGMYTPLKRHTTLSMFFGAVCGAIPLLMGYSAAAGRLDYAAWTLAALLFVWQIPHSLALPWRFADDYSRSGFIMLSVIDASARTNASMLLIYTIALVPIALAPALAGLGGIVYIFSSLVLSLVMVWLAIQQYRERSVLSVRRILLASTIYLPLLLLVLVVDHISGIQRAALAEADYPPQASAIRHNGFELSAASIPAEKAVAGSHNDAVLALAKPDYIPVAEIPSSSQSGGHGSGKL